MVSIKIWRSKAIPSRAADLRGIGDLSPEFGCARSLRALARNR